MQPGGDSADHPGMPTDPIIIIFGVLELLAWLF
jgi:hypothetical protein